jgi:hypothetical protein
MPTPRFRRSLVAVCALVAFAGCRSPQADAYIAEQMRSMGDELNASREQAAIMQGELDSLKSVVARQDSLLTRLAGMAGVVR